MLRMGCRSRIRRTRANVEQSNWDSDVDMMQAGTW